MKIPSLLFVILIVSSMVSLGYGSGNGDILLTIDDQKITKEEFLRVYKKNNENAFDAKSVEQYLDLFINFKLKVIEAQNLGLDETEKFKKELSQYVEQLREPYLTADNFEDTLIQEAFERAKYEVNASHILISLDENASPDDTTFAYNKAMEIRNRILSGEPFQSVARATSDDPSVKQNGGNLGYFTVFQMIYPFESAAYNLKEGELSMPVRTRYGYHIIKLHDKRPARGRVKVAHIMKHIPRNASRDSIMQIKEQMEALHTKIKNGESFERLARLYSTDRRSAQEGGQLPWFGTGQMVPVFADAAFNLQNIGDVSGVVRTDFGFHLIKLLDYKDLESFDAFKENVRNKIHRGARVDESKRMFIQSLKDEYGFEENKEFVDSLAKMIDSSVFKSNWKPDFSIENYDSVLFSFSDQVYLEKDFIDYLIRESKTPVEPIPVVVYLNRKYKEYVSNTLYTYEKNHLDEKYPEYGQLVKEYHDGILLFELTDSMVWSKAMNDTAGLKEYFSAHREDYMWGERVKAITFRFDTTREAAREARKYANRMDAWRLFRVDKDDVVNRVNTDTSVIGTYHSRIYEEGDNPVIDSMKWEKNNMSDVYQDEDLYKFIRIEEVLPPQPKKLEEARGMVIADYQDYLEEKWINRLREKYNVKVNEAVLRDIKTMTPQ